jgi:hypothetical protein
VVVSYVILYYLVAGLENMHGVTDIGANEKRALLTVWFTRADKKDFGEYVVPTEEKYMA